MLALRQIVVQMGPSFLDFPLPPLTLTRKNTVQISRPARVKRRGEERGNGENFASCLISISFSFSPIPMVGREGGYHKVGVETGCVPSWNLEVGVAQGMTCSMMMMMMTVPFRESDLDIHPEGRRLELGQRRGQGRRGGRAGVHGLGRQPALAHQVVRGGRGHRERPQVRRLIIRL